jgi:hypothetical protein
MGTGCGVELGAAHPWLGRLGRKLTENSFLNKNWIFEYISALEICRRRFRKKN